MKHACRSERDVVTRMGVQAKCRDCSPHHDGRRGLAGKVKGRHPLGAWQQWAAATIRIIVQLVACLIRVSVHGHARVARPREPEPAGTSPRRDHRRRPCETSLMAERPSRSTIMTMAGGASRMDGKESAGNVVRCARGISRYKDMSHPILRRSSTLLFACSSRLGATVMPLNGSSLERRLGRDLSPMLPSTVPKAITSMIHGSGAAPS